MDFKIYPKEADEINNTPRFAICDGCGNVVYNYSIKIFSIVLSNSSIIVRFYF
jgi:hypothetical protein